MNQKLIIKYSVSDFLEKKTLPTFSKFKQECVSAAKQLQERLITNILRKYGYHVDIANWSRRQVKDYLQQNDIKIVVKDKEDKKHYIITIKGVQVAKFNKEYEFKCGKGDIKIYVKFTVELGS